MTEPEWEVICQTGTWVRRMLVPGGWLYQVQCGREYHGHPSNNNWSPTYHPPYFVPSPSGAL